MIALVSVVIGLPRIFGVAGPVYQAIAHLWTGGLLGSWLVSRKRKYLIPAVLLTALETAFFVAGLIR